MPFRPVTNVAKVAINATLRGEAIVNILHFSNPGEEPWSESGVEQLATTVGESWAAVMLPVVGPNYTLTHVIATSLEAAIAPTFTWSAPGGSDGTLSGETLPNNCAIVFTHYTGFSGRWSRGRTYLSGLVESQVNGNFLAAGVGATLMGAWNDFMEGVDTENNQLVIVSRWLNGEEREFPIATFVRSTTLRSQRMDSQRRRLPRD